MTFKKIIKIINQTKAQNVILLTHHNADPDALGSAYSFKTLLAKVKPELNVEIAVETGINRLSKQMLEYIPIDVSAQVDVEKADILFLLDTNTVQQLGEMAEKVSKSEAPIIIIDHHALHPETAKIAKLCIINDSSTSTCEVVYSLFQEAKVELGTEAAKAMFLGIAFDSRHFVLGNPSTFRALAEIVSKGVNPQEALAKLNLPMDQSERMARLKACRRAKIFKINNWIIALSHVSACQASAARALIDLGAHVAVVAGKKDSSPEIEISMRCSREFSEQTKIHLGRDVAKPLGQYLQGEFLEGMGGGHAMAAGVNGRGQISVALQQCLKLLKEMLSS
jgi:nanoRNase/pAp phosphatase (c-di-AMP/oligoRNAs hydrolase)